MNVWKNLKQLFLREAAGSSPNSAVAAGAAPATIAGDDGAVHKRTNGGGAKISQAEREYLKRMDLAVRALDDTRDRLASGNTYPRDRYGYDRDEVLADALEAWRVNPLARRVVGLVTQYVVGDGISVESPHKRTHKFLADWWEHRLNRLNMRVYEWCDELSRSGELFIVVSTDAAGMSYLRAIPAADVIEIETAKNDIEQEVYIYEQPTTEYSDDRTLSPDGLLRGRRWTVYDEDIDAPGDDGHFQPVMLHYAINRPVGAKHGESDLAPLLRWLSRYASWLEDRARLNRFRNTFLFWVRARFENQAARLERQADLNRNPPNPGSILVSDETEEWQVLSPKLEAHQASEDGLALKKMVAVGSGNPMHFLAEPEGATRTTAESSGGPTFRHYQQRQTFFLWMVQDLAKVAVRRRKAYDYKIKADAEIKVSGTDISARDNASLAVASGAVIGSFAQMRDRGLIDDAEFLRLAYRFAGEVVDIEDMLRRGEAAPPPKTPAPAAAPASPKPPGAPGQPKEEIDIDPITGEPKGIDNVPA